jgi:hypothetical protein
MVRQECHAEITVLVTNDNLSNKWPQRQTAATLTDKKYKWSSILRRHIAVNNSCREVLQWRTSFYIFSDISCLSVRPSVRIKQVSSSRTDFRDTGCRTVLKAVEKIQSSLKSDKNNRQRAERVALRGEQAVWGAAKGTFMWVDFVMETDGVVREVRAAGKQCLRNIYRERHWQKDSANRVTRCGQFLTC